MAAPRGPGTTRSPNPQPLTPTLTRFYPYHYAPFAADIADAMDAEAPPEFKQGAPFLSFQQVRL